MVMAFNLVVVFFLLHLSNKPHNGPGAGFRINTQLPHPTPTPQHNHPTPNVPTTRMSAPEGLGSVIGDAIQSVKELSAAALIGYGVSTVAYGISIVQVYLYFRNYPRDSIFLKLMVAALWTLDTLSSIVISHALYTLCVLNFNNLFADAHIPWSWPLGMAILTTINTTSLIFYGWQIWSAFACSGVMRGRTLPLSPSIPVSNDSITIWTYVQVYDHHNRKHRACVRHHDHHLTHILSALSKGSWVTKHTRYDRVTHCARHVARDSYCCLHHHALHPGKFNVQVEYILHLLTTYQDVAYPNHFYWLPFYQLVGKLYVNSILASLNVRTSVRGKGQLEVSPRSALWAMEFASGSGSIPHCDLKTANSGADSGKGFQVQLGMMDSMHSESNRDVGIKSFPQIPPLCLNGSTIDIF
ncbi:hypothetical protein C8F04DRAFT_1234434 [Mycena alexandri]|uniref:DUF6534 domain-containing protein n=1 Tax=Mycena alexandri TaxID=1745969 RepID=A0AAD6X3E7_9AGAR|nr:hypothetical protein C8F04DRAFT_1234434 [Mycena alexandri]